MIDPRISELLTQLGYDPATIEQLFTGAIYLTIVSVVAAIPTGVIAKRKGRSVTRWILFELCIPVVPLILIWLLPARKKPAQP